LLVFWVEYTEIVASGPDLAAMSLPLAVVFALMVLILGNRIIKGWRPGAAMTQQELLTVYSMTAVGVGIGGIGMMQFLTPMLVGWRYFSTPENGWHRRWHQFVPHWAMPDRSVVPDYYAGRSSFFTPEHLAGWAGAIAVWSGFILTMLICFYCLSTLLRRQWVEQERLSFPIAQIPMEITRNGGETPIWRNRLLWAGFLLPVVLESMATIHFSLLPSMPYIPLKPEGSLQLETYINQRPWNAIGYTPMAFYPFAIGITYLLPLDVSFSCWFFHLLTKWENVAATAIGLRDAGAGAALARLPYSSEQAVGAWIGLALLSMRLAMPSLAASWRKAFTGKSQIDDSAEPLSYRTAYIGLILTSALLVAFGVALGLSLCVSLLFWALYLLFALAATRVRAEAGLAWGPGNDVWQGAHTVLVNMGGTQSFTPHELTALSLTRWFDTDMRCLSQPAQMEAMKLANPAEGPGGTQPITNARRLSWALLAAAVVGIAAAWVSCLGIYYHYGAASAAVNDWRTGQGHYPFDALQGWLSNPKPPDAYRSAAAVFGLIAVLLLGKLRMQFVWWPLHPIGYAVGNTDIMMWLWCPTLIGWLCKVLILRYGGAGIYRRLLPFFLGLILGDYAASGFWALIFLALGHAGYRTFPI